MSSKSKEQFITELKTRSGLLSALEDSTLGIFVDIALRAYSRKLPKVLVSADNTVVSGQELYDFPTDALRVIKIRDAGSGKEILFAVEDQDSGRKFKLGSILTRSVDSLLTKDYYVSPLSSGVDTESISGYTAFDIEYVVLHTVDTISDTGLEAIALYVEYLALNQKAEKALSDALTEAAEVPASITDRSSDGATTTVSFDTRSKVAKGFSDLAAAKLAAFNSEVGGAYGTRG